MSNFLLHDLVNRLIRIQERDDLCHRLRLPLLEVHLFLILTIIFILLQDLCLVKKQFQNCGHRAANQRKRRNQLLLRQAVLHPFQHRSGHGQIDRLRSGTHGNHDKIKDHPPLCVPNRRYCQLDVGGLRVFHRLIFQGALQDPVVNHPHPVYGHHFFHPLPVFRFPAKPGEPISGSIKSTDANAGQLTEMILPHFQHLCLFFGEVSL